MGVKFQEYLWAPCKARYQWALVDTRRWALGITGHRQALERNRGHQETAVGKRGHWQAQGTPTRHWWAVATTAGHHQTVATTSTNGH